MSIKTNTTSLQNLLEAVNSLPEAGGIELPTLNNEGSASDLLSGKELIDGEGNVVTGTIETKTVSDLTTSGATVTVPVGYYASQVTKSVTTTTQATPSVSIDSNGLITASATQSAGYVNAGTKSGTKQLTTQSAKTITPTTTAQTIASGTYLTGAQTIKGDSNLVASNIKSGVSIFGVSGTLEEGGGGETVVDDVSKAIIERTVTEISDDSIEAIGSYAFAYCRSLTTASFPAATTINDHAFYSCRILTTVSFPAATTISDYAFAYCYSLTTASFPAATTICTFAFRNCYSLTTASFPAATTINDYAFQTCRSLTTASFPAATTISDYAFQNCRSLTTASFPAARTIGMSAFQDCYSLTSFYLTGSLIPTLSNVNAFYSTPMSVSTYTGSFGSIFVPASLVSAYQTATNWATYADRITVIEGDAGGEDDGSIITFTIDDIEYRAEDGMTWSVWCDSEYSLNEYVTGSFGKICNMHGLYVYYKAGLGVGDSVNSSEVIVSEMEYVTA